jgi:hypothetical protein
MLAGALLLLVGLALTFFGRTQIGRLPGDVLVQRGNFTFYFPVVTSILVSLLLSGVLWLLRR